MAIEGGSDGVSQRAESFYEPFASFSAWAATSISSAWEDFLAPLDVARKDATPEDADKALEFALRSAALETGAIEGLYATNRGITRMVALQGAMWEAELDKLGPDVRGHFAAQLAALDLVLDAATNYRPMTLAWLRSLHAQACANQKTYKLYTPNGVVERPLKHGVYKKDRNAATLGDGRTHWYCPPEHVDQEMTRLHDEMNMPAFEQAHAVVQAAYSHDALTAIHPFADGNGRTARALASVFLYRAARIPLIIFSDDDERYLDALAAADAGDVQRFVTYIEDRAVDAMALISNRLRDAKRPLESRTAALRRLFRAQGGLTTAEVVAVANRLYTYVYGELPNLIRGELPEAEWSMILTPKAGPCSFAGLPYHTPKDGGGFSARIESRDSMLRASSEITPFVGISNDAENPFAFLVMDANRPGADILRLRVSDLHPAISKSALERIDGWVRGAAGVVIDDRISSTRAARQGQVYS